MLLVCERYRIEVYSPSLVDGCSHLPLNAGDCYFVMEKETWRVIEPSSGKYEVSSFGKIRNATTKRILKETSTGRYRYVSMWYGDKRVRKAIHILVAKAFLENPNNYPQVNHKDENPANNRVDNLEWCTASYNARYGGRNKRMLEKRLANNGCKAERAVYGFREGEKYIFKSIMDASRKTGVDFSNISKCCRDSCYNKTAGGYIWKYADPNELCASGR